MPGIPASTPGSKINCVSRDERTVVSPQSLINQFRTVPVLFYFISSGTTTLGLFDAFN